MFGKVHKTFYYNIYILCLLEYLENVLIKYLRKSVYCVTIHVGSNTAFK